MRALKALFFVLALLLSACAASPPSHNLRLRGLMELRDDGGLVIAEVEDAPQLERRATRFEVGPDGTPESRQPLAPDLADQLVAAALAAGSRPERTAEGVLLTGTGKTPRADTSANIDVEPVPGVTARLTVQQTAGVDGAPELQVRLALDEHHALDLLHRVPWVDGSFLSGVLLLPAGKSAVLLVGSARLDGGVLYRVEDAIPIRVGAGVATLLGARALQALLVKDFGRARQDLELAVLADPGDAIAHYNLACALALLGELDAALLSLGRAVDLDPERLLPHAREDEDLDALRDRVELRLMIEPRPDAPGFHQVPRRR